MPEPVYKFQRMMPCDHTGHALYTNWDSLQCAEDLQTTKTYLDPGLADERLNVVTYSSANLGVSITETYSYEGVPGNYREVSKVRAVVS